MIEWKEVPGFPGYMVSNDGQVKSFRQYEKILKGSIDEDGYIRCVLFKDKVRYSFAVHQVVALSFIGERPTGASVHHKDENKLNNSCDNLEYITPSHHSSLHTANGKSALRGVRHWKNKMTEEQAREAKRLLAEGSMKQGEIAMLLGVGRTTINEINMGRSWAWLLT